MIGLLLACLCAAGLGLLPLLTRWEQRRRVQRWRGGGGSAREDAARDGARGGVVGGAPPLPRRGRRPRGVGGPGTGGPGGAGARVPLSMLVTEVSARLGAGASVVEAWERSWERHPELGAFRGCDAQGVPLGVLALARRPRWRDVRAFRRPGREAGARVVEVLAAGRAQARAQRAAAGALVAACRFTAHLGAPLADVLAFVADGVDEAAAAEDARRVAGSGPRTSTRVLLTLPLLGVFAGEALGAGPVSFLLGGGIGSICLVVGITCQVTGQLVSRVLTRRAEGAGSEGSVDPAILCDLAVAGLESGASVPSTLEGLGVAADLPELGRIARELLLGVPWGTAWDPHPEEAAQLGGALEPAWTDGTAPVPLLVRASAAIRARRAALVREEAERLAVRLVVPVAALLLPGFVALGVVPVLVHLAAGGWNSLV